MKVFFYGLFMDEQVLASNGIVPASSAAGFVENYQLRISQRATLLPGDGSRAYGVLMDVAADEITVLYSEESVADYVPETLTVELLDGDSVEATCYNLPINKVSGKNKEYAAKLLEVASGFEFPESYLEEIRNA